MDLKTEFEQLVGAAGLVTDAQALEPHLTEWRGLFRGQAPLLVMPADVAEASAVLAFCQRHGIGVVPQGGNTGLAGGAIPFSTPERPQIIVSLARMRAIRELDAENYTITAEAGCLLATVQAAAAAADRLFPLSLSAEGSCQLGGNLSTNAGGINVLRYGNARDLVLGLEVVLADGRVLPMLRALRKDNTGYDLKHLFIGAEGTLGLITAATCKLFPQPVSVATAMVALPGPDDAVHLYGEARGRLGDELVSCELINRLGVELAVTHIDGVREPFDQPHGWQLLLELASARPDAEALLESFLMAQMQAGRVVDAIVAQTEAQRQGLWRLRHSLSEAQKLDGRGIKHDIAVPVSRVPEFLERADRRVAALVPGVRVIAFGHLGDGNLHYNLNPPSGADPETFVEQWPVVADAVHQLAVDTGGTFSAEHGIGCLKTRDLVRLTDTVELASMRAIKRALDPAGIMNPGKLLPEPPDGRKD